MLFNEKYAISHINFSTGFIAIEHNGSEYSYDEPLTGLVRGFSRLIGQESESLGTLQYKIRNSPHDFIIQWDGTYGVMIVAEDIRKMDEIVKYIKNSLYEINYNSLYEERYRTGE